ncbi:cytochrome P450 [Crucibulum laeve]|uniref:Cytochrome P450 n=1 Tax=Crucibulum laeve TaxID=68775 RepID=A0A5C3MBG8_9AGAR|nr:cytochrome P450 [Crucibulum laeve]
MSITFIDAVVCILALLFYVEFRNRKAYRTLPPGPRRLPLLGNLLQMPTSLEWEVYARWGKELNSEMVHLAVGGTSLVVINSAKVANDLLEKRSSIYSDRPEFPMVCGLMGWEWLMALLPYGEKWREQRRLFQQHFHPSNTAVYEDTVVEYVYEFLSDILDTPQDFLTHVRRVPGGIALSLAYGIKIQRRDDPFVKLAEDAIGPLAAAAAPGAFFVDLLPILKYTPSFLPGAGFKRKAKEWSQHTLALRNVSFEEARSKFVIGDAVPSFTSRCLEELDPTVDDEHQLEVIKNTAGMLYTAASDTTVAAIYTFFIAMLHYPAVQRKAQAELDSVIGHSRLPGFGDRSHTPYIMAIVKEVLRWQTVSPQAIPHRLMEDDTYDGYSFPAGTVFIANGWAMLHDEVEYPDPMVFKPERFLDKSGQMNHNIRDPNTMAFGWGRRICAGIHIAEATLWLTIASVLLAFDITPPIDEDGKDTLPSLFYQSSLVSHPLPFECNIKLRSKDAAFAIRSADTLHNR